MASHNIIEEEKIQSGGKVMATVFWNAEGVIMVEFLEQGCTINSVQYLTTLKTLKARLHRVRPTKAMADALLLHDNARPHISCHTTAEIVKIGWEVLPLPPYSPDLAPSDFHLFGPLKEAHRGIHFKDEEAVKMSVRQ
jgi:Transposase and inactivated derivatives